MPTDRLGRSVETVVAPSKSAWVLPQSAYRLLVDYLRGDHTFCNHVVPLFHPFGWVTLRLTAHAQEPQEGR